ncbi:MAG: hypothetical protein PWP14_1841 [Methanolobus sp.]|nr:hypothetical protein [Methanolobus sp.]
MESQIISIIPNMKKSKMLGLSEDTFTLVATSDITIFAKVTNQLMKKIVQESRDQAKAEGKGFFGQWGAQIKGSFNYAERYAGMNPQEILMESPENFSVPNGNISSVTLKKKTRRDREEHTSLIFWIVTITSSSGTMKFTTDADPRDHLQRIYGTRVK